MFVRKKENKSGSISIQIVDKTNGYRVIESIGCSRNKDEIERLVLKAKQKINSEAEGQQWLFPVRNQEELIIENFVDSLENAHIRTVGPELIYGELFNRIGFNKIADKLFRHLVIARLAYPVSKLKTIDYLYRYQGEKITVDKIYRFMDKLSNKYKEKAEEIAYNHTKKRVKNIAVLFYDMTTLYFETEDEDDLRKIGFSKDGKFQKPQILLGLLIAEEGFPIGYDIFEGNKFEGHTLLPVISKLQAKYGFKKPVIVADAALLSKDNIDKLKKNKYRFILGGRIKNESDKLKVKILEKSKGIQDGDSFILKKHDKTRLVVTYSITRAKKDARNRDKGLRKLRQQIKSGKLTKENINNKGYNKFLTMTGTMNISIDENKIKEDAKWDGLKGYITNSTLSSKRVVDNYMQLWQIERAFRISKTDLRIRPMHHYLKRRIEAHISISFVAYTIYKELQHLLKKKRIAISPKRATELTHNMYELEYYLPTSNQTKKSLLKMDAEQQVLYNTIYN